MASIGGFALLAIYDRSPGVSETAPEQWPTDSSIARNEAGDTLLLFAHPHCPCTRASIGELEKIVAHYQGDVTAWVVFLKPEGTDDAWDQSDLVDSAAAIPAVHVVRDTHGGLARRFGATTSGQTLLYSAQGKLLFNGGITSARGHAGDNLGRSAIESLLSGSQSTVHETPVFGCPIAVGHEH